jgi:hypothetical protein
MSDGIYEDKPGNYLRELTEEYPWAQAEWMDFQTATSRLMAPGDPAILHSMLKKGVVRARFSRGHIRSCYLDAVVTGDVFSDHESQIADASNSISSAVDAAGLSGEFWLRIPQIQAEQWTAIPSFPYSDFGMSNWKNGYFGLLEYPYNPEGSLWGVCLEVYGVQFLASDILAVAPQLPNIPSNPKAERESKYDWVRAIAAFAGYQNKHDLIPDVYAYGAQAAIERFLADWFAQRQLLPSETAVRKMAKLLLEEYKAADRGEVK